MAGALALTFDNLGEAAALERGEWPADAPLGRHPSVTRALPRLLDLLDELELAATFFVEALNCELYPDAVREIAARGHELGHHGWRHERWEELTAEREAELLARGRAAFAAVGVEAAGFRPPGGRLPAGSPARLAAAGFAWCSPEGGAREVRDGLAYVPFRWPLVDAYYALPRIAGRELPPAAIRDRLLAELDASGDPTLVMHPFLMVADEGFAAARDVLRRLSAREVAPVGRVAGWLHTGS